MKNPKVAITHLVIEIDTQVTDHVVAMKQEESARERALCQLTECF